MSRHLIDAAKSLLAQMPNPGHRSYDTYHARLQIEALQRAIANERTYQHGTPTMVRNGAGELVGITLTDSENHILRVLWEKPGSYIDAA